MTLDQLRKLDDDKLSRYFEQHARYSKDSSNEPYYIRLGSRHLFSDDTQDLRDQFFAAVRAKGKRNE